MYFFYVYKVISHEASGHLLVLQEWLEMLCPYDSHAIDPVCRSVTVVQGPGSTLLETFGLASITTTSESRSASYLIELAGGTCKHSIESHEIVMLLHRVVPKR